MKINNSLVNERDEAKKFRNALEQHYEEGGKYEVRIDQVFTRLYLEM